MSPERRKELTSIYIRVARDLHWKAEMIEVARVAAIVTPGVIAADFWTACGSMDVMERCANGTHPAIKNSEYQLGKWSIDDVRLVTP